MTVKIEEIDILRGIAILLVLIGHMIPWEGMGHNIIYSFHVPLFFFISGFLFPETIDDVRFAIRKNAKRLLFPYIVTVSFIAGIAAIKAVLLYDWMEIPKMLLSYLWGGNIYKVECLPLGPIWFLLALFWAKSIMVIVIRYVQTEYVPLSVLTITIAGFALNNYKEYVPFQLITAMQAVIFVGMGWYMRYRRFPVWFEIFAVIVWIAMIFYGKMDVYMGDYSYPPLNIVGAFGAFYVLKKLCYLSLKFPGWIISPLVWVGQNSLYFLCCHQVECFSGFCISAWIQWQIHYFFPNPLHYIIHLSINTAMVGVCVLFEQALSRTHKILKK